VKRVIKILFPCRSMALARSLSDKLPVFIALTQRLSSARMSDRRNPFPVFCEVRNTVFEVKTE
jgi:hypothetical protein